MYVRVCMCMLGQEGAFERLGQGRNEEGVVRSLRVPLPAVLSFLSAEPTVLT